MITIYHNPRCRKSREALEYLNNNKAETEVVEYLKNPPTVGELSEVLKKLELKPEAILRKKEAIYKEKFKDQKLTDEQWIEVMVQNPILIERPIIIKDDKAYIARSQAVLEKIF